MIQHVANGGFWVANSELARDLGIEVEDSVPWPQLLPAPPCRSPPFDVQQAGSLFQSAQRGEYEKVPDR